MAVLFKGFSTINKVRAPYNLFDRDLIKRDLLNEFYTKKGERVMRPSFGSIIWDLLMDPDDELVESDIRDDIERIVAKEPRVNLQEVIIFQADHTVRAEVRLTYNPGNDEDILYLEFVGGEQLG